MSDDTRTFLNKLANDRFKRSWRELQQRYPPGTQLNLLEHLGYAKPLEIRKWDANRDASRWGITLEEYKIHLPRLLTKQYVYFHLMRKERCLRHLIVGAITAYVEKELGTNLYMKYRDPTDRKVTNLIRDHFRQLPENQKGIIVRIA